MLSSMTKPHRTLLRTGLTALWLTLLLIGLPSLTLACSCIGNSLLVRGLEKYSTVFLGTVETAEEYYGLSEVMEWFKKTLRNGEVEDLKTRRQGGTLSVEKMWKGTRFNKLTYISSEICGTRLTKGKRYLIYTSSYFGRFGISMCSPIKRAKNHEVEMMFLDWTFEGLSQEEIIDRLAEILLNHKEAQFRIQAVSLLAEGHPRIRSKKIENVFWKVLQDSNTEVRLKVVGNIYNILPRPNDLKNFLLQSFKDPFLEVRLKAIHIMAYARIKVEEEKRRELVNILKKDLIREIKNLTTGDSENGGKYHHAIQRIIRGLFRLQGEEESDVLLLRISEGLKNDEVKRAFKKIVSEYESTKKK